MFCFNITERQNVVFSRFISLIGDYSTIDVKGVHARKRKYNHNNTKRKPARRKLKPKQGRKWALNKQNGKYKKRIAFLSHESFLCVHRNTMSRDEGKLGRCSFLLTVQFYPVF